MIFKNTGKYILASVILLLTGIIVFATDSEDDSSISSQDTAIAEAVSDSDTTFVELHLSADGVYAVDSSGAEWEYDFSREMFVGESGDDERSTTITIFGRDARIPNLDELDIPLEELAGLGEKELERLTEKAIRLKEETAPVKYRGLQLRSVTVEVDERVDGSIVAVGPVTVKGMVDGDVISYKRVTVSSNGVIVGDVRAPEIVMMRGGTIIGERFETELPTIPEITIFQRSSDTAFWVNLIIFFSLLFCSLIGTAVVSKPIDRVKICLEKQFVKSFFVGFGGWFALGPLLGILCLTIIGIPVAVFILPLALVLGIILGIIGVSQLTGELVSRHVFGKFDSQIRQIILGLTALYVSWFIMSLFMISSTGFGESFSILFMVLAIIVWSIAVSAGVGAVVLTRFGTREYKKIPEDQMHLKVKISPAPPPPPSPPPLKSDEDQGKNNS